MIKETIICLGRHFTIMSVSENDHISRIIRASGSFYEFELLNYLRTLGVKGRCAIDVGANIGNHSVFFSAFLAEQVISVEANREIIPVLEFNLSINGCEHKIVECALGEEPGHGEISFPLDSNIGAGRISKGRGSIEIMTLDQIASSQGVFLVKIDVEGMEMDVLRGAKKLITDQRPDLVIEAATVAEFLAIDAFLKPFGYRVLSQWNSTPTYHFSCNHGALARAKVVAVKAYVRIHLLTRKVIRRLARR